MHVHSPLPSIERVLPRFVEWGVTSVRDMGSDAALVARWREAITSGTVADPLRDIRNTRRIRAVIANGRRVR